MVDHNRFCADLTTMRIDAWSAFLVMLFALVGLCGLFASYAPSIPLERGVARSALLDRVLAAGETGALEPFRPALGPLARQVLDGPGPLPERVATARTVVADEQRREASSITYRTRLMLGVITALAAILGTGILALDRKRRA